MSRPLILVANDDGMFAPGIKALVEIAAQFGEVVVVAPNSPQSGQGHAITINDPIRLNRVNVFGDIEAYECSGTPVDCVKLAKNVILKDRQVDLCISGINHGSNASINVIYSGTMSAAMEASLEGIPSIGFSLADYSFKADFKPATPFIKDIIGIALEGQLKKGHLINVNIPNVSDLKGTRICRQAEGSWIEDFKEGEDPRGQKYYWLTGKFIAEDLAQDTDVWAMNNGYISIVPVKHDLTDHDAMGELDGFKMGD